MSNKEENINYTARDIEEYLAGNLSPKQMHAMEKAALDDPFLAEAMEGYEAVKEKEWNNQLVALREAIANKGTIAKVIPLHKSKNNWRKVAAAAILIGLSATLTFIFTKDKKEEIANIQIAQTIPVVKDSVVQPIIPSTPSVTQSLNATASASKEEKKTIPGSIAKLDDIAKRTDADIIPEPGAPQLKPVNPVYAAGTAAEDKEIIPAAPVNKSTAANNLDAVEENSNAKNKSAVKKNNAEVVLGRQQNPGLVNVKKEAVLDNFFTAQIVSADNSPLPFTNISIKKENFGTYADAKGIVRLVSTDSILQVEVKSVGYQSKIFALRNNQPPVKIILQEDENIFKDKKVIANGDVSNNVKLRRATLLRDSVVNVEPADGWDNYNTYVANNIEISEAALKNNRHGEVEISFDVKSNGTISNIRVNKSMGAEYDEAARRLIQEGPQWKVKKGRKTSASIKLQF